MTEEELESKGFVTRKELEDVKAGGFPIGAIFDHDDAEPPKGAWVLNGQTIDKCRNLYPDFYNRVLKNAKHFKPVRGKAWTSRSFKSIFSNKMVMANYSAKENYVTALDNSYAAPLTETPDGYYALPDKVNGGSPTAGHLAAIFGDQSNSQVAPTFGKGTAVVYIALGSPVAVDLVTLQKPRNQSAAFADSIRLEASIDDETWVDLIPVQTALGTVRVDETLVYGDPGSVYSQTGWRFFRITCSKTNSSSVQFPSFYLQGSVIAGGIGTPLMCPEEFRWRKLNDGYCQAYAVGSTLGEDALQLPDWRSYQMPLPDYVGCRNNPHSSAIHLKAEGISGADSVLGWYPATSWFGPVQTVYPVNGTGFVNAAQQFPNIGSYDLWNWTHPLWVGGAFNWVGLSSDSATSGIVTDFTEKRSNSFITCVQVTNDSSESSYINPDAIMTEVQNRAQRDLGNVNPADSFIDMIRNLITPDYTKPVVWLEPLSSGAYNTDEQTFTAPSAGVVVINLRAIQGVYAYLTINGETLANNSTINGYDTLWLTGQYTVARGDSVTFKCGWAYAGAGVSQFVKFFPFKKS